MAKRLCLMGCFAHPDDESYGMGGSTARYSSEGARCVSVCATSGEVGVILTEGVEEHALGAHRASELEDACKILGAEPVLLGLPDGGLAALPEDELADRILELLEEYRPDAVVTFDKTGVTGHTDHISLHRATTEAFARWSSAGSRLFYVVLAHEAFENTAERLRELGIDFPFDGMPEWDGSPVAPDGADGPRTAPNEWVTTRVHTADFAVQKKAAINCHESQVGEAGFTQLMPDEMASVVFAEELFQLVAGDRGGTADDLFGRGADPT